MVWRVVGLEFSRYHALALESMAFYFLGLFHCGCGSRISPLLPYSPIFYFHHLHWLQSNVSVEITSFPKLLLIKTKPPKRRQIENDRANSPKIKPNTGAQLQPTYYPFALSDFDSCWSVPHRALINWLVYGPWVSMYAAAASGRQTHRNKPPISKLEQNLLPSFKNTSKGYGCDLTKWERRGECKVLQVYASSFCGFLALLLPFLHLLASFNSFAKVFEHFFGKRLDSLFNTAFAE